MGPASLALSRCNRLKEWLDFLVSFVDDAQGRTSASGHLAVAVALLCFLLVITSTPESSSAATAARAAEPIERPAELEGLGEHYDLKKYEECHRKEPRNSRCEIYRLKRKPAPEHWPYHQTSPVKWPHPPKESAYRPGMSPIDYWRALCKAEAGEFIYRTVKDVDAIYQIRPRPKESSYAFSDRYVMEDPYGYVDGEKGTLSGVPWFATGPGWKSKKSAGTYEIFETPVLENDIHWTLNKYYPTSIFSPQPKNMLVQRFFGYDRRDRNTMKMEFAVSVKSQYGWTWRGIKREHDRESGVAGGELAVVDLRTGETLGLRRGFLLGVRGAVGPVGWGGGNACPEYSLTTGIGAIRGRNKDFDFSFWFINKVLVPAGEYID